jgi:hypothetical protein
MSIAEVAMRKSTLGLVLCVGVLLPDMAAAQVYMLPNPYPQVTAANAAWRMRGDPVFHAGAFYYPVGPTIFFDGNVMVRTDTYQGVPVYEDATLTPFSIVYIPIGGNVVRPYERRREGELVGTTGSRMPSFPIQRDGELSLQSASLGITGFITPPVNQFQPVVIPEAVAPIEIPRPIPLTSIPTTPTTVPARPIRVTTPVILEVWVPFAGTRWYSAGPAVSYSEDRFVKVGEYQGIPVYRAKSGPTSEIYVPSVSDGPVAPYKRR